MALKLYHGSTEGGITELRPVSKDKGGEPVLYLTDHYAYSLFYLRDRTVDYVTCGVAEDGKVHYEEWFPDQLRILYSGRSGWIYETEAEAQPCRARGILACRASVPVVRRHYVEDACSAILAEVQKGAVVVRSYEEATEEELRQYREYMAERLKDMSAERQAFLRPYFSE